LLCGDIVIYSSSLPYELRFAGPFWQTVLIISAPLMRTLFPAVDSVLGIPLRDVEHSNGMLVHATDCIRGSANNLTHATASHLRDSLLHMLAVAAHTGLNNADEQPRIRSVAKLAEAKRFIRANLGNPELSSSMVARETGLSLSTVHRLFATEHATVGSCIWNERLDTCKQDLADPLSRSKTITDIAFAWGFSDMSHFSRAFKTRFGVSPREWRQSRCM
jgi:AraC-like DNA-binding protein